MKQFELKFYKEWYEALSELSTEDRAAAALALLEYAYDGKLPEDQFIRIVTTLMRNRIDREKASYQRRHNPSPAVSVPAGLGSVSEPTGSLPSTAESSVVEPSGETIPAVNPQLPTHTQVILSDEEAAAQGIAAPGSVNKILRTHYNPGNKALSELARRHNINSRLIAEAAKEIIIKNLKTNPSHPFFDPSIFKRDKLDSLAISKVLSHNPENLPEEQ